MKFIQIITSTGTSYLKDPLPQHFSVLNLVTTHNRDDAKQFESGEAIRVASLISAHNPADSLKVEVIEVPNRKSL